MWQKSVLDDFDLVNGAPVWVQGMYVCMYVCMYGSVSRVANPPPPHGMGPKPTFLATFSWNPPKHMVFTMF